jgi:putative flippase GtrA
MKLSPDFIRFGIVGTLGFCWDTATVYALRHHTSLYAAGTAGFLVAASANWLLNRLWTFRHQTHEPFHRQWAKFLAANLLGFCLNRGTFFILISVSRLCHNAPVLAIIAGSFAGLTVNYFLSKRFVFR